MVFEPLKKDELPVGRDSLQEVYFEWWLEELIKYGFIKSYSRCKRYMLIKNTFHNKLDFKPTKKIPLRYLLVQREFLKSWSYEPDYRIVWTEKSFNFLFKDIGFLNPINLKTLFNAKWINKEWISIIDIKPPSFKGGIMSSSVKFPLIQKMMYNKYNIYVHKISPIGKKSLFEETFTPDRYMFQDKKKVNRRISQWKPISIKDFLNQNNF